MPVKESRLAATPASDLNSRNHLAQNNTDAKARTFKRGYLRVANEIVEHYLGVLSHFELKVYLSLCRYSNNNTQLCYPTYEQIITLTGKRARREKVSKAIRRLSDLKLIALERTGRHNDYLLLEIETSDVPGTGTSDVPKTGTLTRLNNKTLFQDSIPEVRTPTSARFAKKQRSEKEISVTSLEDDDEIKF